jgi:hypothetical protein
MARKIGVTNKTVTADRVWPKEDKSVLGCGKEVDCGISHKVDGSGVWCGKVDGCGHGEGRDEQHCTLVQQPRAYCWSILHCFLPV